MCLIGHIIFKLVKALGKAKSDFVDDKISKFLIFEQQRGHHRVDVEFIIKIELGLTMLLEIFVDGDLEKCFYGEC